MREMSVQQLHIQFAFESKTSQSSLVLNKHQEFALAYRKRCRAAVKNDVDVVNVECGPVELQ
ncbi:uncharacterized protein PHALS_15186 [Plasmopara halstedii]|uniref:Uncharacterized protein n=1 Tax=Plasmopara halstedii TaxID=4781 RepID=A0A0P1B3V5_PLAHL|nr:uncharacterized protein PHALS_15186 [Plasmopara halstedii]CEG48942.1 hypothetical protein PHALS_15186 [Plasmopara halstedii]|eukprot:XP_024585311.1 hypothetical protein PHALS_15186 [Plasmopara halstedii]